MTSERFHPTNQPRHFPVVNPYAQVHSISTACADSGNLPVSATFTITNRIHILPKMPDHRDELPEIELLYKQLRTDQGSLQPFSVITQTNEGPLCIISCLSNVELWQTRCWVINALDDRTPPSTAPTSGEASDSEWNGPSAHGSKDLPEAVALTISSVLSLIDDPGCLLFTIDTASLTVHRVTELRLEPCIGLLLNFLDAKLQTAQDYE
jgi:hypothetical protein